MKANKITNYKIKYTWLINHFANKILFVTVSVYSIYSYNKLCLHKKYKRIFQ